MVLMAALMAADERERYVLIALVRQIEFTRVAHEMFGPHVLLRQTFGVDAAYSTDVLAGTRDDFLADDDCERWERGWGLEQRCLGGDERDRHGRGGGHEQRRL